MIEKILVPLDGSLDSEASIPIVEEIASGCQTKTIHLLYVTVFNAVPAGGEVALDSLIPVTAYEHEQQHAATYLDKKANELKKKGLSATYQVLAGHTGGLARHILEVANTKKMDMIVMSTHGRGGLGRILIGSVASRVVQQSKIPVLLVRPREA